MAIKIIKNEQEYQAALSRLSTLMDAELGSTEGEELEVLALLIENYEKEHFPVGLPDPIEAIKFRMEQQGLSRKDLEKIIGSQSKVSEVLNHKRPLSLAMIRSLHEHLGIPYEVLLKEPGKQLESMRYNPNDYPLKEMHKAGYFPGAQSLNQVKEEAEEWLENLFSPFQSLAAQRVFCRSLPYNSSIQIKPNRRSYQFIAGELDGGNAVRETAQAYPEVNICALIAWQARVLQLCAIQELPSFSHGNITNDFFDRLVRLSYFSKGPQMAAEYLNKTGIHFIILSHLPGTYLDGACFYTPDHHPVIGMTLRYDRLDNFWFTLVHELAHLCLHLNERQIAFFDDTESPTEDRAYPEEEEANEFARNRLIPPEIWDEVSDELLHTDDDRLLKRIADRLEIHPAIVAGRVRWETRDFSRLTSLVGHGKVRPQFPEFN